MLRCLFAALVAAALLAAPLPMLAAGSAQAAQSSKTATQAKPKKAKRPLTPAQQAMRARMKQCGAEWHAAKKAGTIKPGMKWPQYWSACNKRLKSGG